MMMIKGYVNSPKRQSVRLENIPTALFSTMEEWHHIFEMLRPNLNVGTVSLDFSNHHKKSAYHLAVNWGLNNCLLISILYMPTVPLNWHDLFIRLRTPLPPKRPYIDEPTHGQWLTMSEFWVIRMDDLGAPRMTRRRLGEVEVERWWRWVVEDVVESSNSNGSLVINVAIVI